MPPALPVLFIAALAASAAAIFVLAAYRRAEGGATARALPAFGAALAAGLAALGLYLAIGRPDLPGASYQGRLEALKGRPLESLSAEEVLAILDDRARAAPGEAEPHLYSGQIYLSVGDAERAARSFDAALRRTPGDPQALLGLGRALVQLEQGRVSDEALDILQQAAAADPQNPAPWLYLATGAMQADDAPAAASFWREARARMSEDDPRQEMATRMIAEMDREARAQ